MFKKKVEFINNLSFEKGVDILLSVSLIIYLLFYWFIFDKIGLWDGMESAIKDNSILSNEYWFIITSVYLFITLLSVVTTHEGVYLWRRNKIYGK